MIGITVVTIAAANPPIVHTTGVNWESVVAIVTGVVTILSILFTILAKLISGQITGAINKFRNDVVNQLDIRLTRVEGKIDAIPKQRR